MTELEVRAATLADLQVVTETISLAFHDDPTWSWAFPDPARRQAHYAVFWRFMIGGAIRYPWVRMTDGGEAVAIWIPPGGTEVAPEDESGYEPLLQELVGSRSGDVLELLARFDAAHPQDEPHYYLTLLGTDPLYQRTGAGSAALQPVLDRCDTEGLHAYLETQKEANLAFYARHAFELIAKLEIKGLPPMWTMSRKPRG